jgi:hypothetical protein
VKNFKHPTSEELYALERWAQRERAKAQAELLKSFFSLLRKALSFKGPSAKSVQRHAGHHA